MFIGIYNKSVILTYIGVASAVSGIYYAFSGKIAFAILALIVAGVCDLFDGKIARRTKRNDIEKEFGVQIDSLADTISFAALPAAIALAIGVPLILIICYCLCAIIRLGYFNVVGLVDGNYLGLPVTFSSAVFSCTYCSSFFLSEDTFRIVYSVMFAIVTVMFILKIKFKKPLGIWYGIFSVLAILMALLILYHI